MQIQTKAYTSPTLNYEMSIHDILSLTPLCPKRVRVIIPAGAGAYIKQIPLQYQGWNVGGGNNEEIFIDNGAGEGKVLQLNIYGFDEGEPQIYDSRMYANGLKSLYIRASKIGETIFLQGQF